MSYYKIVSILNIQSTDYFNSNDFSVNLSLNIDNQFNQCKTNYLFVIVNKNGSLFMYCCLHHFNPFVK